MSLCHISSRWTAECVPLLWSYSAQLPCILLHSCNNTVISCQPHLHRNNMQNVFILSVAIWQYVFCPIPLRWISSCVVQYVLAQQIYSFWCHANAANGELSHLYSSDCLSLVSRRPLLAAIWTPIWLKNRERKLFSLALEPKWRIGNVTDECAVRVCVCLRLLSAVPLRDKALEVLRGDDIISLGWCLPCLSQDRDAPRLRWRRHRLHRLTSRLVTNFYQEIYISRRKVRKRCGPHATAGV